MKRHVHQRLGRGVARATIAFCAGTLMLGLPVGSGDHADAAGADMGAVQLKSEDGTTVLTSGGSATHFQVVPPAGAACPGSGSGTPSYRWQTYIVSDGVDVSTMAYATGPQPIAGQFVSPLYDTVGNPIQNKNPAASPLGLISGIPVFSFENAGVTLDPGDYKLGFACTQAGDTVSFWTIRITVAADASDLPAHFTWTLAAPPAPPITGLAAAQIAGPGVHLSWTAPTGTTPTDYTVGIAPTVGSAPFTVPGSSTTFDITGLTEGLAYTITVTANYSVAPLSGPPATVPFTYTTPAAPPITGLAASQIAGPGVHLTWTPPTGTAPVGYTIGVAPAVSGTPFSPPAGATSFDITTLVANTAYNITLTANYATAPLTGPPATVSFTFVPAATTTTSTTTTTTTIAGTTTTSAATTTSAVPGPTTSTVREAASPVVGSSTTTPFISTLATTGTSSVPLIVWATLLLALGWIVVLIARPIRVRSETR